MENTYYVKSLDSDNTTKTLEGDKKVVCQNLSDILSSNIIKTNTRSFGQKMRLSTTILHDNYLKTYRPQGVIFKTDNIPDYVLPFDLILLSETDNIVVHYYQMKDNLHQFYNHKLIVGYKQFVFKNIGELVSKFKTPVSAWREVNTFRLKNGQKNLKSL